MYATLMAIVPVLGYKKLMAIVAVLGYKNYNLEARSVTEWAGLFKLTIAVATNLLLP